MFGLNRGTIRLFRVSGIEVFLHWSWFVVAAFEISDRTKSYSSPAWNILEYLTLFLIVLLHEFGHALACRSVGGTANRIVPLLPRCIANLVSIPCSGSWVQKRWLRPRRRIRSPLRKPITPSSLAPPNFASTCSTERSICRGSRTSQAMEKAW